MYAGSDDLSIILCSSLFQEAEMSLAVDPEFSEIRKEHETPMDFPRSWIIPKLR